jgi:hypothetical protein
MTAVGWVRAVPRASNAPRLIFPLRQSTQDLSRFHSRVTIAPQSPPAGPSIRQKRRHHLILDLAQPHPQSAAISGLPPQVKDTPDLGRAGG